MSLDIPNTIIATAVADDDPGCVIEVPIPADTKPEDYYRVVADEVIRDIFASTDGLYAEVSLTGNVLVGTDGENGLETWIITPPK